MNTVAKPSSVMPLRYVESVDAMRAFYLERLGFDHLMGMVGADGRLDFAIVQRAGAMLMLSRPQNGATLTSGSIEIYVEVEDVDAATEELRSAGVEIVFGPERSEEAGLAWTHFRAPDGNIYGVIEFLRAA